MRVRVLETGPGLMRAVAWAAAALVGAGAAQAQQANRPLSVSPSLSVSQTLTDGYLPQGGGDRRSEAVTTISPGVRVLSRSGPVQGTVDYSLSALLHARDSEANDVQHRLAAQLRAEVVRGHLDVNAGASISRQNTSAFGTPSVDGTLSDRNQSSVRTLSLQPVLRGVLGGAVAVQASANASTTDGGAQVGSRSKGAALSLGPASGGRVIGWDLTGSRQISSFDGGRETTIDRAIASVIVRPDVDLQLTVRGGVERSDLASVEQRQSKNYGAGLTWTPTPRTFVQIDADKRQFGQAHVVRLEHRMRRSVWRYSDSRSINDGTSQSAGGASVTAYDLFFQLFASQEPDPVARDLLVRDFLARNGIDPDTRLGGGGFLTSAVSIQRRQELSLAINAQRTSWTVSAFRTVSERGDTVSGASDDLANGPVTQRGMSVTITHRLTPLSSLSLTGLTQRSSSDTIGRTGLDSLTLGWTMRTGPRSTLAVSVRHAEYEDIDRPYTENAVTAAFTKRF